MKEVTIKSEILLSFLIALTAIIATLFLMFVGSVLFAGLMLGILVDNPFSSDSDKPIQNQEQTNKEATAEKKESSSKSNSLESVDLDDAEELTKAEFLKLLGETPEKEKIIEDPAVKKLLEELEKVKQDSREQKKLFQELMEKLNENSSVQEEPKKQEPDEKTEPEKSSVPEEPKKEKVE